MEEFTITSTRNLCRRQRIIHGMMSEKVTDFDGSVLCEEAVGIVRGMVINVLAANGLDSDNNTKGSLALLYLSLSLSMRIQWGSGRGSVFPGVFDRGCTASQPAGEGSGAFA